MSPLYSYNGLLLVRNGALAVSSECCCDDECEPILCSQYCYDISFNGTQLEYECDNGYNVSFVGSAGEAYVNGSLSWQGDGTYKLFVSVFQSLLSQGCFSSGDSAEKIIDGCEIIGSHSLTVTLTYDFNSSCIGYNFGTLNLIISSPPC